MSSIQSAPIASAAPTQTVEDLRAEMAKQMQDLMESFNRKIEALTAPPPAPVTYSIGTKLRWQLDDENFRVAFVTKGGILQMKINENGNYAWTADPRIKKMFENLAAWQATLPAGGNITATERDGRTSVQKKSAACFAGRSDAQLISGLLENWDIKGHAYTLSSPVEIIAGYRQQVINRRAELAALTLEDDLEDPSERRRFTKSLERYVKWLHSEKMKVERMGEEEARLRTNHVHSYGTSKLRAFKDGQRYDIGVYRETGQIVCAGRMANTFEELGIEMVDGRPRLEVLYRRKTINLWETPSLNEWYTEKVARA